MIYRINDTVTDLNVWGENYSSYAMAEAMDGATYRIRYKSFEVQVSARYC